MKLHDTIVFDPLLWASVWWRRLLLVVIKAQIYRVFLLC